MNWMNYSKPSPHSRSKTDISSPSGSSGILDKLKNDINRIELMRQSEFADEPSENIFRQRNDGNSVNKSNPAKDSIKRNLSFSSSQDRTKSVDRFFRDCESTDLKGLRASPMTNSFLKRDSEKVSKPYNVSALGKDESSILDNRKKELPKYDRSKSVDRFFRDSEPTFMKSTRASILQRVSTKESKPHNAPTLGRDKPNYFEKKENELLSKLSEKDEEIKQVQDRLLKEKVEKEEMVKNLTSQISDTTSEINEARSNESKLKKTLLEVIKNLENERETKENEVLTSNSLQSVELKILQEELLCSAEKVRELKENEKYVASMLKGEIADKNEIISELESNLELLKTSLDQLMESKEDLEQTYCRKIEHLVMTLEEQKADEEKRIVTLEDSIRSNEKDWSNKVRRLEVENEQLQKSLEEVKKSLEDVKHSSADEFNILQTNLTQKIDALESEKVLMGRRLADMGKENKGQVIKVEKLTKSLSDSKSEHFETVNSLKISLEKTKEATAEIRSELSCKQMKLDSAISEVSNLTRKVDELMTEKKTLERDNEKLSTQVQAKNKQLEDTNKSNQELLTKIDDMKTEVDSFKQQNSKIREYEEQVKVLESSLDSSMTKSTIMGNEITSLQSDLKSANECLQVSKKKNAWLQKERDSLQEERDSLQKNIAFDASNAKDKESELRNKIQKLTSQKDSAEKKISELEKGMKKSKEDGKSRNEQLKSALSSLDEMMKYIESMREENDEIVKSLEVEIENVHTSKNEIEKEMKNRYVIL